MIETVVLCRPHQVREAAIVLSCVPAGTECPLIVIEPAATNEATYRELFRNYTTVLTARDAVLGGQLGLQEFIDGGAVPSWDPAELERLGEALTPYRSWVNRNLFFAELFADMPLRRYVLLFEPVGDELTYISAVEAQRDDVPRVRLLPEGLEPIPLIAGTQYHTLSELCESAWRVFHGGEPLPVARVVVPEQGLDRYFTGLVRALRECRPLYPAQNAAADERIFDDAASQGETVPSAEAVLIEVSDDAAKLLGIVFAAMRGARVVVMPAPSVARVEAARRETMQRLATGAADPLEPLEKAVAESVPPAVVAAVGDRELTVFTSGIPYSFVKQPGADWTRKPIGHISGDASLLMLQELYTRGRDDKIGFNVIFDPGYFDTTETKDVLTELQGRVSYPLVLSGQAGSTRSLLHLGATLPVELVFFNTHGADESIILAGQPLPAYRIAQWLRMPSRPVVFNSSCLSWVGVGREFIRAGARAYVGTLWSVNALHAAQYAKTVIGRMAREETPIARAMLGTGVDPVTERAYIFVGPNTARLTASVPSALGDAVRLEQTLGFLLQLLFVWLNSAPSKSEQIWSLAEVLWQEVQSISRELTQRFPDPSFERLDLLLMELRTIGRFGPAAPIAPGYVRTIVTRAYAVLDGLHPSETKRARYEAALLHGAATCAIASGSIAAAVPLLEKSVERAAVAGDGAGSQYLELSDAQKNLGNMELARDAAQHALDEYTKYGHPDLTTHQMLAVGRLTQASRALGKFADAMQFAKQGYALAEKLDNKIEKGEFKGDEARIYLALDEYEQARTAADEFLKLTRIAHDELREVTAYGVLAQALIGLGQLDAAMEKVHAALEQAERLQLWAEVGDFALDAAHIARLKGDPIGALDALRDGVEALVRGGQQARLAKTFHHALAIANDSPSWNSLSALAELAAAMIDALPEHWRVDVTAVLLDSVRERAVADGAAASRTALARIFAVLYSGITAAEADHVSDHRWFMVHAIHMFAAWSAGDGTSAREKATELDDASSGRFRLIEFLDQHPPPA